MPASSGGSSSILFTDRVVDPSRTMWIPTQTKTFFMNGSLVTCTATQAAPASNGDCVSIWHGPGCAIIF